MIWERYGSVGLLMFFSHFSIVVSATPSPRVFESFVIERERSIRFLRRCSPSVFGLAGYRRNCLKWREIVDRRW